jgi:hypothetical protein
MFDIKVTKNVYFLEFQMSMFSSIKYYNVCKYM